MAVSGCNYLLPARHMRQLPRQDPARAELGLGKCLIFFVGAYTLTVLIVIVYLLFVASAARVAEL